MFRLWYIGVYNNPDTNEHGDQKAPDDIPYRSTMADGVTLGRTIE